MEARIVDIRKIQEKCNIPKIEALQTYILNNAKPGEVLEIIVGDADTWYAFIQLGETLGYKIIESRKEEDEYIITIKIE